MRCLIGVAAVCVLAAPVLASPDILPERGTNYGTYNLATGEFTPGQQHGRYGDSVWSSTTRSGYYYIQMYYAEGCSTVDWGDITDATEIGGYAISYSTDLLLPDRLTVITIFYAEENGYNSQNRVWLAGFQATDLPTGGDTFNGWTVTFDLEPSGYNFTISGSDLDFDGLTDFGYFYWFTDLGASGWVPGAQNYTGPTIAGDPNVEGPGMENVFDRFLDPNLTDYVGPRWFGGSPYAQFYMELFEGNSGPFDWPCVQPGGSGGYCTADIDTGTPGDNCIVGLADLAQLLGNYGTTSGAAWGDGDVDPVHDTSTGDGGDGDVDLGDLAELLSQYGDDCN